MGIKSSSKSFLDLLVSTIVIAVIVIGNKEQQQNPASEAKKDKRYPLIFNFEN